MSSAALVGIIGSLRADSANGATARAAASTMAATQESPAQGSLAMHNIADVPFYNGDVEAAGLPPSVNELAERVGSCDGIVLFSPEYNGSFPAVTKNVIDWLSRPPRAWEGKAITMVSTTPGPRAGKGVRDHFSAIMTHQPVRLFETLGIGGYGDKIEHGTLTDRSTLAELADFMNRFAQFCQERPDGS